MPQVLDPGGITAPLPISVTVILPSPLRDRVGCHTPFDFGATYPFTLVTAYCLPVYASQCLFPSCRDGPPTVQNSVPGCWLNFAGVTISSHQTLCASRRTPHRTGLADLPHPALQADSRSCGINPRVTFESLAAISDSRFSSVDNAYGLCVPHCFPSSIHLPVNPFPPPALPGFIGTMS